LFVYSDEEHLNNGFPLILIPQVVCIGSCQIFHDFVNFGECCREKAIRPLFEVSGTFASISPQDEQIKSGNLLSIHSAHTKCAVARDDVNLARQFRGSISVSDERIGRNNNSVMAVIIDDNEGGSMTREIYPSKCYENPKYMRRNGSYWSAVSS